MFPILKTEQRNADYVCKMLCGISVSPIDFDLIIFKDGCKPERPGGPSKAQP